MFLHLISSKTCRHVHNSTRIRSCSNNHRSISSFSHWLSLSDAKLRGKDEDTAHQQSPLLNTTIKLHGAKTGLHLNDSVRNISSVTELVPEFMKQYSIWGGSGVLLKTFHSQNIPYWACMSLTNITVRSSLVPLVIKGAKTSAKFANVAPEVQFLVSSFTKDSKKLKEANARPSERLNLLVAVWQSLRGLYKLHGVNPLDVFKSPLMQIPVFWYFSVDIRKIINGGDPELAQQLTDSGFLWVTDLTDPDPWYGLPILSGMFLYLNVEVAVGRKSLSGETTSKSNLARYLKDGFQSLAVLMPCFMSQSPAGVQIYLLTSFIFTLFQGAALRSDPFRELVGLPVMNAPLPESIFAKEFIQINNLESKTFGVLSPKLSSSYIPYDRVLSRDDYAEMEKMKSEMKNNSNQENTFEGICALAPDYHPSYEPSSTFTIVKNVSDLYINIVNTAEEEKKARKIKQDSTLTSKETPRVIAPSPDDVMDAANRGERPPRPIKFAPVDKADIKDDSLKTKSLKLKRRKKGRKSKP